MGLDFLVFVLILLDLATELLYTDGLFFFASLLWLSLHLSSSSLSSLSSLYGCGGDGNFFFFWQWVVNL